LEAIQNGSSCVGIVRDVVEREIAGNIVRPDCVLKIFVRLFRFFLLQVDSSLDNRMKIRVGFDSTLAESLDQVAAAWRIKRYNGPDEDQNDDDKSPKVISINDGGGTG